MGFWCLEQFVFLVYRKFQKLLPASGKLPDLCEGMCRAINIQTKAFYEQNCKMEALNWKLAAVSDLICGVWNNLEKFSSWLAGNWPQFICLDSSSRSLRDRRQMQRPLCWTRHKLLLSESVYTSEAPMVVYVDGCSVQPSPTSFLDQLSQASWISSLISWHLQVVETGTELRKTSQTNLLTETYMWARSCHNHRHASAYWILELCPPNIIFEYGGGIFFVALLFPLFVAMSLWQG